ncbi:hypothetical protein H5398_11095 [Tessaracoccus sp. MC1679]|uniref:hypothetical protein n=1 Tax=Tessaracoccus sp. MC1679 TaxID=2760313 RepID=UPI0016006B7F|nr:hypothetical protein [Tessaracoccus sp. MC1679]MBB1516509.1 hypothetical protein [Tessaracoccus sp. MC1679]
MSEIVWILFAVVALAAAAGAVWGIRRHLYVKELTERGWTFVTSPSIAIAYGLNVPPFGMGFKRSVDDQIIGRASDGTQFSAFRYKCSQWKSGGYVVTVPLGRSLLPAEVFHGPAPKLSLPGQTMVLGELTAAAGDPAYAEALVEAAAPALTGPYRVTVDGEHLVLVDAPKEADGLAAAVEQLAATRARILASPAATFKAPLPPPSLSFYGRPDWTYVPRDDSYLQLLDHSGGGRNHQAHDIIFSDNDGLPFLRLRHEWETTHTRTDAQGRTHTETRHHSEELCEFRTTFPFQDLSVNWELLGPSQKFEWEDFNRRYKVRTPAPRFASDVMHQRQMEYLMAGNAPKFAISGDRIMVGGGGSWEPEDIDAASRFLHGFFARVPDFVWRQLGAWPRPIPELAYDA